MQDRGRVLVVHHHDNPSLILCKNHPKWYLTSPNDLKNLTLQFYLLTNQYELTSFCTIWYESYDSFRPLNKFPGTHLPYICWKAWNNNKIKILEYIWVRKESVCFWNDNFEEWRCRTPIFSVFFIQVGWRVWKVTNNCIRFDGENIRLLFLLFHFSTRSLVIP